MIDAYQSWAVLAGYFDGDGNIEEVVGRFVVVAKIGFKDNWDNNYLLSEGFWIETVSCLETFYEELLQTVNFSLAASSYECRRGIRDVEAMLPYVFKKRKELEGVLNYLEDRITGDELIALVNNEVEIGNKTGKIKQSNLPYLRSQGEALRYSYSLERARKASQTRIYEVGH